MAQNKSLFRQLNEMTKPLFTILWVSHLWLVTLHLISTRRFHRMDENKLSIEIQISHTSVCYTIKLDTKRGSTEILSAYLFLAKISTVCGHVHHISSFKCTQKNSSLLL
jgi:hypothetical protein